MTETSPSPPPQILLVEDEPLIRMMAGEMLELLGYGVVEAGSGAEALAGVHGQPLDGVLIDLGLPDQPGEAVIRQIHDMKPDLPIIVCTGADTRAAGQRLADCGVIGFLEKPYYFNDLERVMADIPLPA
jgi:CheY-like chemotaxis protein